MAYRCIQLVMLSGELLNSLPCDMPGQSGSDAMHVVVCVLAAVKALSNCLF